MEIKAGYKRTDVGVFIPNDWEEKTFIDVMTGFTSGQTPSRTRPEYFKGNIPWITSGELNHNIITDTIEKITPEAVQNTNLKIIPKGTFLFAITGLEAEGTRGSCAITGIDATTNQSCMALYPTNALTTKYLFYYYEKFGNWLAFRYCQGTKQQSYSGAIARKLPIIYPPNPIDQRAITTALSDVDAFITSLDMLIAKKRDLKQAAMQELLTGKRRLSGFNEKWKAKTLGEVATIVSGGTPKTSIPEFWDGNIAWCTPTDITGSPGKYLKTTERCITDSGLKNSSASLLPVGSLLLCSRATIGEIKIASVSVCTNQGFKSLICKVGTSFEFLYYK